MGAMGLTAIRDVSGYSGQTIEIGCWLARKRSSGKIRFLQLRDGTGFIQGVVVRHEVDEATWEAAGQATQECAEGVRDDGEIG